MIDLTIDQEYIKPLVELGKINILDKNECYKFDEYISTSFPWLEHTDRIDWSDRTIKELNLRESSIDQIKSFVATSNLSSFEYFGIVFSAFEPGVYGKSHSILENLFAFIAHIAGPFFIVAIEFDKFDLPYVCKEKFIEGNGMKYTLIHLCE